MRGPTAPKDPESRKPFFYIMREKEIFGAPQPDGRGIQFIYEDSGETFKQRADRGERDGRGRDLPDEEH